MFFLFSFNVFINVNTLTEHAVETYVGVDVFYDEIELN